MRAVFTNFGTRGDFQPLCILAKHARDRGHVPVFAIPAFAREMVEEYEFETFYLSGDFCELRDQVNRAWISQPESYLDTGKLWHLLSPFQQYLASAFEELLKASRGADVLISGPAQPLSRIVHDYSGIPFVSVQLNHLGGSGGPALEHAGELLVNPFRRALGLAEIKHPFTWGANSPQLALYAVSPHLLPRHKNWPSHYRVTGFWFEAGNSKIDPELKEFMGEGPPPVVVTFGSMTDVGNSDLRELVSDVCRIIGARAVMQGSREVGRIDDYLYCASYVPHHWLFRQAACVVLHGGTGTAAAVFRAGVPGVFVPHICGQDYWARVACEMGCALEPLLFSDLNADRLAAVIQRTIQSESIRLRAAELGWKIRKENGTNKAWQMIGDLVDRIGLLS